MLELRFIRENLELVKEKTAKRGLSLDRLIDFATVDQERLTLLTEVEALKNKRNTVSKDIAMLKKGGHAENAQAEPMVLEMRTNSARIKELDDRLTDIEARLQEIVMAIPNLCSDSVPVGQTDSDNIEIRQWGTKPTFSFQPKPHWEVGEGLKILDFERAAKITGARFALLTGLASRLERALINFMSSRPSW